MKMTCRRLNTSKDPHYRNILQLYHGSTWAQPRQPGGDVGLMQTASSLLNVCIVTLHLQYTAVRCIMARFHVHISIDGTDGLALFKGLLLLLCYRPCWATSIRYAAVESLLVFAGSDGRHGADLFARVRPDGSCDEVVTWESGGGACLRFAVETFLGSYEEVCLPKQMDVLSDHWPLWPSAA